MGSDCSALKKGRRRNEAPPLERIGTKRAARRMDNKGNKADLGRKRDAQAGIASNPATRLGPFGPRRAWVRHIKSHQGRRTGHSHGGFSPRLGNEPPTCDAALWGRFLRRFKTPSGDVRIDRSPTCSESVGKRPVGNPLETPWTRWHRLLAVRNGRRIRPLSDGPLFQPGPNATRRQPGPLHQRQFDGVVGHRACPKGPRIQRQAARALERGRDDLWVVAFKNRVFQKPFKVGPLIHSGCCIFRWPLEKTQKRAASQNGPLIGAFEPPGPFPTAWPIRGWTGPIDAPWKPKKRTPLWMTGRAPCAAARTKRSRRCSGPRRCSPARRT